MKKLTEIKPPLLRRPMNGMNKQAYMPKHGMAWHLNLGQATFAGLSSMENQDKYLEPNSLKLC